MSDFEGGVERGGISVEGRELDQASKRLVRVLEGTGAFVPGHFIGKFGKERVLKELEEFLSLDLFPRFGGGIGMTRMMRAMNASIG